MTFEQVTRATRRAPGEWSWEMPEGWRQGRGAFGGLALAVLARAAGETDAAAGRPLRAITAEIPAPVLPGPAVLRAETLRAGSGLTTIAARIEQDGETCVHAVLSFARTRATDLERGDAPRPSPPRFADVPVAPSMGPLGPEFTQHVEYRLIDGAPFAGRAEAATEGWVRLREPGDVPREVALVALVDAWFPSLMPTIEAPRPFGTISFAAHLFDRAWSLDEPLHHRSRLVASQQGYFVELRELHTPGGELCAFNQQTMAIIR